ncbi:MAG TPA: hypothetical protein DCQ31_15955 [Bacteroidales bacterium]|nr:hypothetical protein [Bacteroidales bacterium]
MKLQIGMPVYNGERYVKSALDSLIKQTYTGWELIISNNASTDNTGQIIEQIASSENRIRVINQAENIGAAANFRFVFEQTAAPYFMWAACDDVWEPEFIEKCIALHLNNKNLGLTFSNIVNINNKGFVNRRYNDFNRLISDEDKATVCNYILDNEYNGKANLIYGIYKRELCAEVLNTGVFNAKWGSDYAFVTAILCRSQLGIVPEILFKKRLPNMQTVNFMLLSTSLFDEYCSNLYLAAQKTSFEKEIEACLKKKKMILQTEKKLIAKKSFYTYINRMLYMMLHNHNFKR